MVRQLKVGIIFLFLTTSVSAFGAYDHARVEYKEGKSATDLKKLRRMAVGVQAVGALGLGGAVLEVDFSPEWAATVGFGGGSGFQAWQADAKYTLFGDVFSGYAGLGFARWTSNSKLDPISGTTPSILGNQFLTSGEKAAGEFQINFLYPSLGLQFLQLAGDWAGISVYAEVLLLTDLSGFKSAPTGALGFLYYF